MLLFDKDQVAKLREKNSSILDKLTERISDDLVACFNTKFNRRMDRRRHPEDIRRHFFKPQTIYKVLFQKDSGGGSIDIVKGVAFVYLANEKKKNLTIAVLGVDSANKLLPNFIFSSSRNKNEDNEPLTIDCLTKKGMEFYKAREIDGGESFDMCRNAGVLHEPVVLKEWLDVLKEDNERKKNIRIYLGIDDSTPSLQVPMLIDNTKEELSNTKEGLMSNQSGLDIPIFTDREYALDRGNGCCPEQ
jgi:hypothetical protein